MTAPVQSPPQAWPPPAVDSTVGKKRRLRKWLIGVAIAAAALVALGVVGVVVDRTVLTHELLTADFTNGAAPFQTQATGSVVAEVVDGTYRMRATAADGIPTISNAPFARVAYNVVLTTDVVAVTGPGAVTAVVGTSCRGTNHIDYELLATASGSYAALLRTAANDPSKVIDAWAAPQGTAAPVHALTLTCTKASPLGNSYDVTGAVNGYEILRAHDGSGPSGISGGALVFRSDRPGTQASFDNVRARVP